MQGVGLNSLLCEKEEVMRVLMFLTAVSAFGQTAAPPAFEVASVKVSSEAAGRPSEDVTPAGVTFRNANLTLIMRWAYKLPASQISGPPWLEDERFDIVAKAAGPAKEDEMRPMMQTLLTERFKLQVHRETRTMPVFALVEAKGGHKMKPSSPDSKAEAKQDPVKGSIVTGATMAELALDMAGPLNAPVLDMTGLKGGYDFIINIRAHLPTDRKPGDPPPDPAVIFMEAVQKDLGLRLEPRKAPVEVLVIDHMERRPIEN